MNNWDSLLTFLTLNSTFLSNLGLFHGRMGCALFFAKYSYVSHEKQYEDFAEYIINDIISNLHKDFPIELENGLCGIGWGIEYLAQYDLIEGDVNEWLIDVDSKIMERDPLLMEDVSFRHGLLGIAFYVSSRLNSKHKHKIKLFNISYLCRLKKALERIEESEEIPNTLFESIKKLKYPNQNKLDVFDFLTPPELICNMDIYSIGLDGGIAGYLLKKIISKKGVNPNILKNNSIYIFEEECRAQKYGVGTYINQLLAICKNINKKICFIHLKSHKTSTIDIQTELNITHIYISGISEQIECDGNVFDEKYYKSALMILLPYFTENAIYHLNYMNMLPIALTIKKYYPKAKLIATVHYTEWGFALLGNKEKLHNILSLSDNNNPIYKSILEERKYLQLCDKVIAIAKHSYCDLINIYHISPSKLIIIPHGIEDKFINGLDKDKIRRKYGFKPNELILIFAGRVDEIKGINILINALPILVKKYPNLKLIIAGDGDYNNILKKAQPAWANLVLTGWIDKQTLYELFAISDIGIVPSIHEEFGYVALEMMMMELPIIAGNTTGLSEIIINQESGFLVTWEHNNMEDNTQKLVDNIASLLNDKNFRIKYKERGRKLYIEKYSFNLFKQRMIEFYINI